MLGPSPNCWRAGWSEARRGWRFGPRGFIELRDGGRKRGTRQGQGDGRSLGTEQLPISQLPLLNTGITGEAESENVHVVHSFHQPFLIFLSFSHPYCCLYTLPRFLFFLAISLSLILSVNLLIFRPSMPAVFCFFIPFINYHHPSSCVWAKSRRVHVTEINTVSCNRPICGIMPINQAASLKGHSSQFSISPRASLIPSRFDRAAWEMSFSCFVSRESSGKYQTLTRRWIHFVTNERFISVYVASHRSPEDGQRQIERNSG